MCGPGPVLALLGVTPTKSGLLAYGASGDTSGDRSKVVGYAAVEVRAGLQAQPSVISTP
jgi:AmmeMemoRadiSam system protein B